MYIYASVSLYVKVHVRMYICACESVCYLSINVKSSKSCHNEKVSPLPSLRYIHIYVCVCASVHVSAKCWNSLSTQIITTRLSLLSVLTFPLVIARVVIFLFITFLQTESQDFLVYKKNRISCNSSLKWLYSNFPKLFWCNKLSLSTNRACYEQIAIENLKWD